MAPLVLQLFVSGNKYIIIKTLFVKHKVTKCFTKYTAKNERIKIKGFPFNSKYPPQINRKPISGKVTFVAYCCHRSRDYGLAGIIDLSVSHCSSVLITGPHTWLIPKPVSTWLHGRLMPRQRPLHTGEAETTCCRYRAALTTHDESQSSLIQRNHKDVSVESFCLHVSFNSKFCFCEFKCGFIRGLGLGGGWCHSSFPYKRVMHIVHEWHAIAQKHSSNHRTRL